MGLSFLLRFFASHPDGGLFGYLKRRNDNRTRIELERERRVTSLQVIGQLGPGDEYRESTPDGWREIRKAQVPSGALFVLSETVGEQEQATQHRSELPGQHPRPIDAPSAATQLQHNDPGGEQDDSTQESGTP
jgi:hypothetical protein